MAFAALIFDLDGTLLDTLEDLADAMNAVLVRNRLPVHPLDAYRRFVGDGIPMLVRRALPFEVADEDEFHRFVAEMNREYAACRNVKTRPYPGAEALLDAVLAKGLGAAVLTNKPQEAAEALLAEFFPRRGFRSVCGARPGRARKPDPAGALEIARVMGVAAERCLLLGDSGTDMQTAVAAGMYPAGALWGFRPAEELLAAGAKLLLPDPRGLIPWL